MGDMKIGDWVCVGGEGREAYKIFEISKDKLVVGQPGSCTFYASKDQCSPIPVDRVRKQITYYWLDE